MTIHATFNPIGSSNPKDLIDNAQNLDYLILGPALLYPDRRGVNRLSWAGIEASFAAAQAQRASAFDVAQLDRAERFDTFIETSGYDVIGDYASQPVTFTERNQLMLKNGELWKPKASVALPYVTTGVWASESASFVSVGDAALRQELASDTGSMQVYDKQAGGTTYKRPISGKLDALASIRDYGTSGVGNGVTSDHLAAIAMGEALGYIHFSRGNYVLDTCTLDYPVSFDKKANTTVNAGHTVTYREPITSPKQNIFKGVGNIVLTQNDAAAGENVREVHVSWFGAFPSLGDLTDQGPAFRKLFTAVGNRESIAHCDVGGYTIDTPVPITRAGWVKGAASRRTVFKSKFDGFPFFVDSAAGLAKITDCNFEMSAGTTTRNSPFIEFTYNEFELANIRLGQSKKGIVTSGNAGRIYNITAAYGANQGAGSDLIQIKGGSGVDIEKIQLLTSSSYGPESIVRVGGVGHLGVGNVNIRNIQHITPSISVSVEAFDLNISGVFFDGVQYSGFAGTPPAQMIKLETSGAGSLDNVNIGKIQGGTRSIAMVSCLQNSSGFMRRIVIDGVQDRRTDGNGIELIRTNGILEDVDIGSGVQLKTRSNPVYRSGTLGTVRVASGVEKDSSQVISKFANILDDSVYVCPLGKSVFVAGVKLLCAAGATFNWGDYIVRAASSPAAFGIQQSSAMTTALTALNGTTGTDGKITLGITDGVLYVENRSGAAINITMTVTGS